MTGKGTAGVLRIFHSVWNIPAAEKQPICKLTMDLSATNIFIVIDEDGGRASKSKMS